MTELKCRDENHSNWLKGILAFQYLKEGIVNFVDYEAANLHASIQKRIDQSLPPCILGCSSKDIQTGKWPRHCKNWFMSCRTCNSWLQESIIHRMEFLWLDSSPENTYPQLWPTKPWEIMKLYMCIGCNYTERAIDASVRDILSLLKTCKHFHTLISRQDLVGELLCIRNILFHSSHLHVESTALTVYLNVMLEFLQQMTGLTKHQYCQRDEAVAKIKQLQITKIDRLSMNELGVCLVNHLEETNSELKEVELKLEQNTSLDAPHHRFDLLMVVDDLLSSILLRTEMKVGMDDEANVAAIKMVMDDLQKTQLRREMKVGMDDEANVSAIELDDIVKEKECKRKKQLHAVDKILASLHKAKRTRVIEKRDKRKAQETKIGAVDKKMDEHGKEKYENDEGKGDEEDDATTLYLTTELRIQLKILRGRLQDSLEKKDLVQDQLMFPKSQNLDDDYQLVRLLVKEQAALTNRLLTTEGIRNHRIHRSLIEHKDKFEYMMCILSRGSVDSLNIACLVCGWQSPAQLHMEHLKMNMIRAEFVRTTDQSASISVDSDSTKGCKSLIAERTTDSLQLNLLELVQFRTIKQVEHALLSDRPIAGFKTSVDWTLQHNKFDMAGLLLKHLCRKLAATEGKHCVEAFPAYRKGFRLSPVFVVLSKQNCYGEWNSFMGFSVYKRRHDAVSHEASLVINNRTVQENLLSLDDLREVKQVIRSACLHQRHENITIISACPVKSKQNGDSVEKGLCIVIHCLLKGFIPFNEKPFPEEINGIAVDVREGFFQFGGKCKDVKKKATKRLRNNHSHGHVSLPAIQRSLSNGSINIGQTTINGLIKEALSVRNTAMLHNGPKSRQFNTPLRMGGCIGPSGGEGSGTLGGFVTLRDGGIGALTCAHVAKDYEFMSQPADAELDNASSKNSICRFGKVCESTFEPGSTDTTGVDAAIIELTDRHPTDSDFVRTRPDQLKFAGFDPMYLPTFKRGEILSLQDMNSDIRHITVLKSGAETGLTCGKLYLGGVYVRTFNREIRLPNQCGVVEFFNQIEISTIMGPSTCFFNLGDSGALAFMPLNGQELTCIGMCIGYTSYGSCIVTPIDEVFSKTKTAVGFKDFSAI